MAEQDFCTGVFRRWADGPKRSRAGRSWIAPRLRAGKLETQHDIEYWI
ncbi:MAG: hypothetical protein PVI78_04520 [Anaerolineales bacterium]